MRTTDAKRITAAVLVAAALIAVALALVTAGVVTDRAGSGADPSSAFLEIPTIPEDLGELVFWEPDEPTIRPVEPDTRRLVEATLVRGWEAVDIAQRTGDRSTIEARFLPGIGDQVARSASAQTPASVVQHRHQATVTFYSVDGSVMTLDLVSDLERRLADGPTLRTTDSYEVVLLLSDGNWRIQHLTRIPAAP